MRRKKKGKAIVLKPQAAIVPAVPPEPSANLKAVLEGMVRKRVDEILAASGMHELSADYRPTKVAHVARQVDDLFERKKWSLYFDKWGCRICGKKTAFYGNTGHCQTCAQRIHQRLTALRRDYEKAHPEAEIERNIERLTLRARTAERLLREGR